MRSFTRALLLFLLVSWVHAPEIATARNMQTEVMAVLEEMITAYQAESPDAFMAHVAQDFTGDRLILDSAIRDDFSYFENIDLRVTLSGFARSPEGYAYVTVTYVRRVIAARSGSMYQDSGLTEMGFKIIDGRPRLYTMKNPLLFGVSDARNAASGIVRGGGNKELLVVDENGGVAVLPFDAAVEIVRDASPGGLRGSGLP